VGFEVAVHVADAGDSVGDEQRKRNLPPAREPVSEDRVDVHVPQTWNEELARGVHHQCPGRESHRPDLSDLRDLVPLDDDRHAREREPPGGVDHGDVSKNERGWR
jgi:hypothetical protein